MSELRTSDLSYGQEYWETMDDGAGYKDSVMWEDLAFITRELLCIDPERGDITSDLNFLDVGCAFGFLVRHLRRRGLEAWGIDLSQWAIDHAPDDTKGHLRQFDITSEREPGVISGWPFQRFACFETMEHIPEEQVPYALNKIYRCTAEGGRGLFTICTSDRPGWDSDPTHVTIHPREWWEERLEETGFKRDFEKESWLRENFWLFREHSGIYVVER